jgi:hypothetical protein
LEILKGSKPEEALGKAFGSNPMSSIVVIAGFLPLLNRRA